MPLYSSLPTLTVLIAGLLLCGCDRHASRLATDQGVQLLNFGGPNALAEAKENFNVAVELDPTNGRAYGERARILVFQGLVDKAKADLDKAIRFDSENPLNYCYRAHLWFRLKKYGQAIEDFQTGIEKDYYQQHPFLTYNGLAWLYATAHDKQHRNGAEAVKLATKACELTSWKDAAIIDTLAAAYAETGDFQQAEHYQTMAIRLARGSLRAELLPRLGLYKAKKAYRHEDALP